jgi:hypothetical protein
MQRIERKNFHVYVSEDEYQRMEKHDSFIVDYAIECLFPFLQFFSSRDLRLCDSLGLRRAAASKAAVVICHGGEVDGRWFWEDAGDEIWAADYIRNHLDGKYNAIFVFACNPAGEKIRIRHSRLAVNANGDVSTMMVMTKSSWFLARTRKKEREFSVNFIEAFDSFPRLVENPGLAHDRWLRNLFAANGWSYV